MKCPECVKQGLKSTINVGYSTVTCMGGGGASYDEDGNYHFYDPNTTTTGYSCSNGHRWVELTGAGRVAPEIVFYVPQP